MPIRVGERAASWQRHVLMIAVGLLLTVLAGPIFAYSDRAADDARDDNPKEQAPVDIAVRDMADARHGGGKGLGGVNPG